MEAPLRILLLGPAYPYRGGLAAFNEQVARGLQARGHEVIIYTFTLQYPSFLFPGKTQYVDGPPPDDLHIERKLNAVNPLNWWQVGREIQRLAPDLLITRFWLPFMGPSLGTVLRVARRGTTLQRLAIVDNIIPHEARPGDRPMTHYFTKAVDGFLVMSRAVQADMQAFISEQPVVYSPHPVYDHYGKPVDKSTACRHLGLDPTRRYLLFFGFIRDYKGLDLLLRAMADPRLIEQEVHLIVAGEYYGNAAAYAELMDQLQLHDRLVLRTDYIPDSEVRYYFGAADLVVQPYKSATQSGISQMAYHFEKPMVVTDVGGLPEIVPDGEAGYVVPRDPAAIAEAIVDFFTYERAAQLCAGVRARKSLFSWDTFLDKLLSLVNT